MIKPNIGGNELEAGSSSQRGKDFSSIAGIEAKYRRLIRKFPESRFSGCLMASRTAAFISN